MRKTITDDPDKDRKNVARAMAALFRVPLLICAMASAKNGGLELAIKSVDSYGIMLIEKLTTLGIPKDSSVAVVNKYLGMAKQYAELMVVFCDINRTKLMSVETVEQYFRIIADGLEIKIPEVPELANKKFAEVMSIYTYSDEYYLIRNEIRNTQFIPADSIDEFNENV